MPSCAEQSFVLEGVTPALQGPLNHGSDSVACSGFHRHVTVPCCPVLLRAVRSFVQEGVTPALQGPLNSGSDSVAQHHQASDAIAVSVCSAVHMEFPQDPSSAAPPSSLRSPLQGGAEARQHQRDAHAYPECTSAVVTAFSDGRVYAHVMQGLAAPAWTETSPQCITDSQGVCGAAPAWIDT